MNAVNKNVTNGILMILSFWLIFVFGLLFYPPIYWTFVLPEIFWIKQCMMTLLMAIIFFLNYFYFTPNVLLKRKYLLFSLIIIALTIALLGASFFFESTYNIRRQINVLNNVPTRKLPQFFDGLVTLSSILMIGVSTSFSVFKKLQKQTQESSDLQKQNLNAELSFLKAQINPHFFFNTLNSIYSLSYTDIEKSRSALQTLSRMMRYILYDSSENKTNLMQEIAFINDHISLMRLRLNDNVKIIFINSTLQVDHKIAPMILMPFIENAFKHGVSVNEKAEIIISLQVENNKLSLKVINTRFDQSNSKQPESYGIGLSNTKRRLELIYPGQYELHIDDNGFNKHFKVELTLELV